MKRPITRKLLAMASASAAALLPSLASAEPIDMSMVVQIAPTVVAHPELKGVPAGENSDAAFRAAVMAEVERRFSNVAEFSPDLPASSFIRAQMLRGQYVPTGRYIFQNKDHVCVTLTSEFITHKGTETCDKNLGKAVRKSFDLLARDLQPTWRVRAASGLVYDWASFLESTSLRTASGEPAGYVGVPPTDPVLAISYRADPNGQMARNARKGVRELLAGYFAGTASGAPTKIFKTADLMAVILSDSANMERHRAMLERLIDDTPSRYRLWPYIMMRAVTIGAPVDLIQRIAARRDDFAAFTDPRGNTPLHIALTNGDLALAELFVNGGADVNAANKQGHLPIHFAAISSVPRGDFALIDLLLDAGAKIDGTDPNGVTPLLVAMQARNETGRGLDLDALLEGFMTRGWDPAAAAPQIKAAPIYLAVAGGSVEATKRLLATGMEAETKIAGQPRLLDLALEEEHAGVVAALLAAGADGNLPDDSGRTPLDRAYPDPSRTMSIAQRNLVRVLVAGGADPTRTDASGQTAEMRYTLGRERFLERQRQIAERKAREERERRERAARAERRRLAEKRRNRVDWLGMASMVLSGVASGLNEYNNQVRAQNMARERARTRENLARIERQASWNREREAREARRNGSRVQSAASSRQRAAGSSSAGSRSGSGTTSRNSAPPPSASSGSSGGSRSQPQNPSSMRLEFCGRDAEDSRMFQEMQAELKRLFAIDETGMSFKEKSKITGQMNAAHGRYAAYQERRQRECNRGGTKPSRVIRE
ncbi:MAG: hypothetical protein COA41_09515 [Sphingopyxis sp.]|nr:MAG: hypothetical protein COA41_09515 [Sphingopyxis sp.]